MTLQCTKLDYVSSSQSKCVNNRQNGMKPPSDGNISFGREQMADRLARSLMPVLIGALFATGCHKAVPEAPAPPPPPTAAAPDTNQQAPAYTPPPRSSAPPQATGMAAPADPEAPPLVKPNGDPDLHQLDQAMLRWIVGNRRSPSSFQEFAASAGVAIPPPPPGKKYAIEPSMHIILVNAK
jgi:hypothetical protein